MIRMLNVDLTKKSVKCEIICIITRQNSINYTIWWYLLIYDIRLINPIKSSHTERVVCRAWSLPTTHWAVSLASGSGSQQSVSSSCSGDHWVTDSTPLPLHWSAPWPAWLTCAPRSHRCGMEGLRFLWDTWSSRASRVTLEPSSAS